MKIYQINRKLMAGNTVCRIANGTLELDVSFTAPKGKPAIHGSYNLADIINSYSEDHGCIGLCYSRQFPNELIWHETTRFSHADRMPPNRSYSSAIPSGLSLNDLPSTKGRHNVASPASVLTRRIDATPFLWLLTPTRDCSPDDAIIVFHGADNEPNTPDHRKTMHSIFVDRAQQTPPMLPSLKQFLETWLPVGIKGPATVAAGSSVNFTISAPDGATVYLDATAGRLNRAQARNGQKFLFDTSGLEAGEIVSIKAGYKFWPGTTTMNIALT